MFVYQRVTTWVVPNTMLDMTDNTGLILLVVASLVGKNNPRLRKKIMGSRPVHDEDSMGKGRVLCLKEAYTRMGVMMGEEINDPR